MGRVIGNQSFASTDGTILRHCRCMDCRKFFSDRAGECFCREYIGGTKVTWATGKRECDPPPDAWHYCSDYDGPQISTDVWVWQREDHADEKQNRAEPWKAQRGCSNLPTGRGEDQPEEGNVFYRARAESTTSFRTNDVTGLSRLSADVDTTVRIPRDGRGFVSVNGRDQAPGRPADLSARLAVERGRSARSAEAWTIAGPSGGSARRYRGGNGSAAGLFRSTAHTQGKEA